MSKIIKISRKQLKGKNSRDFPKGSILIIGKYRIHINGLETYAEHDKNPMIALKEYSMPRYIRDIVF
jgi:hypothetical protein